MIHAKLGFRCAAMHDLVTPMIVQPALIGWEPKQRRVDLHIERAFNGEELFRRMKGWVIVDPNWAIEVVKQFGNLKVLDDRDMVVELEKMQFLLWNEFNDFHPYYEHISNSERSKEFVLMGKIDRSITRKDISKHGGEKVNRNGSMSDFPFAVVSLSFCSPT